MKRTNELPGVYPCNNRNTRDPQKTNKRKAKEDPEYGSNRSRCGLLPDFCLTYQSGKVRGHSAKSSLVVRFSFRARRVNVRRWVLWDVWGTSWVGLCVVFVVPNKYPYIIPEVFTKTSFYVYLFVDVYMDLLLLRVTLLTMISYWVHTGGRGLNPTSGVRHTGTTVTRSIDDCARGLLRTLLSFLYVW